MKIWKYWINKININNKIINTEKEITAINLFLVINFQNIKTINATKILNKIDLVSLAKTKMMLRKRPNMYIILNFEYFIPKIKKNEV